MSRVGGSSPCAPGTGECRGTVTGRGQQGGEARSEELPSVGIHHPQAVSHRARGAQSWERQQPS